MRKFLMSEGHLWSTIGGLLVLNAIQTYYVYKFSKMLDTSFDQRKKMLNVLEETLDQREHLARILVENDVELSEFDQVMLDALSAKLKIILQEFDEGEEDA